LKIAGRVGFFTVCLDYQPTPAKVATHPSVNAVNVGTLSADPGRFNLLKAELYWSLRERFAAGEISGLDDDLAVSQLSSIRYKHDLRGRVVIESKEDAKKRGHYGSLVSWVWNSFTKSVDRFENLVGSWSALAADAATRALAHKARINGMEAPMKITDEDLADACSRERLDADSYRNRPQNYGGRWGDFRRWAWQIMSLGKMNLELLLDYWRR
jgi:hypothetical protein